MMLVFGLVVCIKEWIAQRFPYTLISPFGRYAADLLLVTSRKVFASLSLPRGDLFEDGGTGSCSRLSVAG